MRKFTMVTTAALLVTAGPALAENDYPTLDRVDHVLTCMKREGGQTVDNLYACSCEIDVIAQAMPFDEFNDARTFEAFRRMPGEKGSPFRDSAEGKALVEKLAAVRADARKRCFIGKRLSKAPQHGRVIQR